MAQGTGQGGGFDPEGAPVDRAAEEQRVEEQLLRAQDELETVAGASGPWSERAGAWLRQHRRALTVVAGGAVIAAVGFMTAARMRH